MHNYTKVKMWNAHVHLGFLCSISLIKLHVTYLIVGHSVHGLPCHPLAPLIRCSTPTCRWVARIVSYVNTVTAAFCSGGEERVRHFHNGGGWVRRRECVCVCVKRRRNRYSSIARNTCTVPKMALNPNTVGKKDSECTDTGDLQPEGGEPHKKSAATSATANQNGDQPGCGDSVMPEQKAPERQRSVQADARSFSSSPLPGQKPVEELPRRNFQIPRKTRERRGGAISLLF